MRQVQSAADALLKGHPAKVKVQYVRTVRAAQKLARGEHWDVLPCTHWYVTQGCRGGHGLVEATQLPHERSASGLAW